MKKYLPLLLLLMAAYIALCASIARAQYTHAPVVTGTGLGFISPTVDHPSTVGGAAAIFTTANWAICKLFFLPFTRTVTQARWYVTTGAAGSTGDAGLYDINGNLVVSLGGVSTAVSSTAQGGTVVGGSKLIQGGNMYYGCMAETSTTLAVTGIPAGTGIDAISNAGITTTGTFVTTGGILPSTMPALTAYAGIIPTVYWF